MDEPQGENEQPVASENEQPLGTDASSASEQPEGTKTLRRSSTKKVFGGVCGGIAERFDIDANIVRVIFVVLALVWGLGVAIYLAMWVILPRAPSVPGEEVAPVEEERPVRHWLRYALLLGVVFFAVIVFTAFHGHYHVVGQALPVIWLTFLVVLAVVALSTPARRLTFRRLIALTFLGFLSLLILVSGSFLILLQVIGVPLQGGSGVKVWRPITTSGIQSHYHEAFGDSTIDLAGVPFTSGTWSITATQGVGELTVDVPPNVSVELRTHVGIGNVQCLPPLLYKPVVTTDHRTPARLELNLQVGIGTIALNRVGVGVANC